MTKGEGIVIIVLGTLAVVVVWDIVKTFSISTIRIKTGKMFTNFKSLPIGYQRLFKSLTIPVILPAFSAKYDDILPIICCLIISYWIVVLIGCWVYVGFKTPNK